MSNLQPRRTNPFFRAIRKVFVSGFVVFTFAAYALHEHFGSPAGGTATLPQLAASAPAPVAQATASAAPPRPTAAPAAQAAASTAPPAPPSPTLRPTVAPTAAPAPTDAPAPTVAPTAAPALAQGQYADGEYSGPVTDAYYGNVQVKAVIQAGKIADVQFLEYPSDRRTSVRINNVAMPYLINEAIQAQSANVNVISGATLTSEAFAQSLQVALNTAKNHT